MRTRRTRQLEAVYAALQESRHPTASEIHNRVRSCLDRVSLGTVYRNLEKLIASGRVTPLYLGESATRYDAMVDPHDHFVCERCGGITDLAHGMEPVVDTARLRRRGFGVRQHSLAVFGLCPACCGKSPRRGARAQRTAGDRIDRSRS